MTQSSQIAVGVVGATGYTGVELLRLLAQHPSVRVDAVTSRSEAGRTVSSLFPSLRQTDWVFEAPDVASLSKCDIVFFATPNGVAMKQVPELLAANVKVVDLGADFRFKDAAVWEQWYGMPHECPEWLARAAYGLPEFHREAIRQASVVGNPGCYPTSIQLPLVPLLSVGLIESHGLIADCKSGVSGAGRKASISNQYSEVNDSFKAYGVEGHRHVPEIKQGLSESGQNVGDFTFIPHLVPMTRGIFSTIYAKLKSDVSVADARNHLMAYYSESPFVDVFGEGEAVETRFVTGSNRCAIALSQTTNSDQLVVTSVIDNLIKGAAGQAIQNMNVMFGRPEAEGLSALAWLP